MKTLTIFYDNWCQYCTRFAKFVERHNYKNRIVIKQLRNPKNTREFPNFDKEKATEQKASFDGEKWLYGFDTLYKVALRLPILWILVPFFFILKMIGIGNWLYLQLAVRRKIIPLHCDEDCRI